MRCVILQSSFFQMRKMKHTEAKQQAQIVSDWMSIRERGREKRLKDDTLVTDTSTGWILLPFLKMGKMGGEAGFGGKEIMSSPLDLGSRDGSPAISPNVPFIYLF